MIPFEQTQQDVAEVKKDLKELKALLLLKAEIQVEDDDPKSIDEIEIMTGFAKPTLYGYVRKKSMPFCKINGRLFFFKSEIIEWIKQGRQKTNLEIDADTDTLLSNKRKSKR